MQIHAKFVFGFKNPILDFLKEMHPHYIVYIGKIKQDSL